MAVLKAVSSPIAVRRKYPTNRNPSQIGDVNANLTH